MAIALYEQVRAVLVTEVQLYWADSRDFHLNTFRVSGERPVSLWRRELNRLDREVTQRVACLRELSYSPGEESLNLRLDDSQPTRAQRVRVIEALEEVLTEITGQPCRIRRRRS